MSIDVHPFTDEYAEFLRDESRSTGYAESISFPSNGEELAAVIGNPSLEDTPLTIQGGRTGLSAAAVPQGGHIINLSRMDRILGARLEADGSAFVTVQPGVVLGTLRKALLRGETDTEGWDENSLEAWRSITGGKYFFSPDPTETSATIGGMVGCGASGARSFGFGSVRSYVESMRLVLADGRTLSLRRGENFADGRVFALTCDDGSTVSGVLPNHLMPNVKNASGYYITPGMDMLDLFIGGEGTLSIASEIELRLRPSPAACWGITSFFPDEKSALRFVRCLRGDACSASAFSHRPIAIEFFDERSLRLLREKKRTTAAFAAIQEIKESYNCAVYTELHGDGDDKLFALLAEFTALLALCGGDGNETWAAVNSRDMEKLQFFRHAVPECVNMTIDERRKTSPTITKLGTDMAVTDRDLEWVMAMYRRDLDAAGLDYVVFGHIGSNHLHVNILPRDSGEYATGKALYLKWAREISARGGTVSAEHGVGKLKADFFAVMAGEKRLDELRALKSLFDPGFRLNPGNMFSPGEEVRK